MNEEMKERLNQYMKSSGYYNVDQLLIVFDGYTEDDMYFITDDVDLNWFSPETRAAEQYNREKRASEPKYIERLIITQLDDEYSVEFDDFGKVLRGFVTYQEALAAGRKFVNENS